MNRPAVDPTPSEQHGTENRHRNRLRFEAIFASIWLAIGLFVLPAAIYAVGGSLLGPYGDNAGMGRFYGDFFGDLAEPSVRAWALALGPLIIVYVLRLVFVGAGRPHEEPQELPEHPIAGRRAPEEPRRVEPRVSE